MDAYLDRLATASSLAKEAGEYSDVPMAVEAKLREICQELPEVTERPAWAGTQWRIRNRMFAHVLTIDFPDPDGPVTVLVFRSSGPELDALRRTGLPFFRPAWGKDAVGMVVDPHVSWNEVAELVTDSYCTLAPKKLAALVERPGG